MVNGIFLRKFEEQTELIENILIKYIKPIQINKGIEDVSKIKNIHTIKTQHNITSICELRDNRIVSSSDDGSIFVYNKSYESQFSIQKAHNDSIWSLYMLRNGDLVSSSSDCTIKVWRINENDYSLIRTIQGHNHFVTKVIELKNGKLCSCSFDKTVKIWDNCYICTKILTGHTNWIFSVIEMNDYIVSVSKDKTLMIWHGEVAQCMQVINDISCSSTNSLSKFNDSTLLVAGHDKIYVVDIHTYKKNKIKINSLVLISCSNILGNGQILFGTEKGEICSYDLSSNQIISKCKFHNDNISCLIEGKYNKLISCSDDKTINIYN